MKFILMCLSFPEDESSSRANGNGNGHAIHSSAASESTAAPVFSEVTTFKTTGVVMNVFLLDPPGRLLASFIWVSGPNTIGLYTLLDWDSKEYVYIDTGIECVSGHPSWLGLSLLTDPRDYIQLQSSNWSCILHEDQIVIHSEEADAAYQHFYPMSLLSQHRRKLSNQCPIPALSARVSPARTQSKRFVYPPISRIATSDLEEQATSTATNNNPSDVPHGAEETPSIPDSASPSAVIPPSVLVAASAFGSTMALASATPSDSANPFPSPTWLPESAHFVRQWWPTLPGVPRVSCTVILLADHDPETHQTRFAFAQHYFTVPFNATDDGDTADTSNENQEGTVTTPASAGPHQDADMMKMWYVSTPFDVVYVNDSTDDDAQDRSRPLVAVDFGHAVWIEHCDTEADRDTATSEFPDMKCLRFVTFPSIGEDDPDGEDAMEGVVRTLDEPDELDLDTVETINIDQSQGAVILSSTEGKIYFLFYT